MCVTSAAQAEARALVETLDFLSTRSLQLESDTLVLIRAVTGADHFARDGEVLISVAKRKLMGFDDLSLDHSEMRTRWYIIWLKHIETDAWPLLVVQTP